MPAAVEAAEEVAAVVAAVALEGAAAGAGASAVEGRMARSGNPEVPAAHRVDPLIMAVRQANRATEPVITALPVEVRRRQRPVMPAQRAAAEKIRARC